MKRSREGDPPVSPAILANFRMLAAISHLAKAVKRLCDQSAADIGLTGVQGHVMGYLIMASREGDLYQRNIEEIFQIRPSSASGILKLLERDGYIRRIAVSGDARLKKIVIAPKARRMQEKVLLQMGALERRLQATLTPREAESFVALAQKVRSGIA